MYNALIVENTLHNMEKVANILSHEINYIRISNITSNFNTALNYITSQNFEIIILSSHFLSLLDFIQKNQIYHYRKSILVLSDHTTHHKSLSNNPYCFTSKIIPYKDLDVQLKKMVHYRNNSHQIRTKIHNELTKLNYNYSYTGTRYIEDSIFELYKNQNSFNGNLKKEIYPILSTKYKKSVDTIYGNIKQATKYMLLDCKEEVIIKYFNYNSFNFPKIKEIIFTVLNKI